MASKLAATIFQSGAKDDLITTDVYNASTGVKNTASKTSIDSIISSSSGILKPSTLSLGTINGIIGKGLTATSSTDITSRLISCIGGNKNAFESLTTNLKGTAIAELTSAIGIDSKNVQVLVGETSALIEGTDLKSATGILGLLSAVTGNSKLASLLDLGSEFSVIKALVLSAIAIGIPAIVDAALDHMKDEKKKKELLLTSLRQAAIASDLTTINKALDYVGADGVIARCPDIVTLILTNYKWSAKTTANDYSSLSSTLINTLNRIDARWHTTTRNGVDVSNLAPFTTASSNALTLLKLNSSLVIPCSIAPSYPKRALVASIKAKYPKCRISLTA